MLRPDDGERKRTQGSFLVVTKELRHQEGYPDDALGYSYSVQLLADTIKKEGLGSCEIVTAQEAHERLKTAKHDVVIINAGVYGEDSPVVASALRATAGPGVFIAVLTHSPTWKRCKDALCSGADDYTTWPTNDGDMVRMCSEFSTEKR